MKDCSKFYSTSATKRPSRHVFHMLRNLLRTNLRASLDCLFSRLLAICRLAFGRHGFKQVLNRSKCPSPENDRAWEPHCKANHFISFKDHVQSKNKYHNATQCIRTLFSWPVSSKLWAESIYHGITLSPSNLNHQLHLFDGFTKLRWMRCRNTLGHSREACSRSTLKHVEYSKMFQKWSHIFLLASNHLYHDLWRISKNLQIWSLQWRWWESLHVLSAPCSPVEGLGLKALAQGIWSNGGPSHGTPAPQNWQDVRQLGKSLWNPHLAMQPRCEIASSDSDRRISLLSSLESKKWGCHAVRRGVSSVFAPTRWTPVTIQAWKVKVKRPMIAIQRWDLELPATYKSN